MFQTEFVNKNRNIIEEFLNNTKLEDSDLSALTIVIICQFLLNMRVTVKKIASMHDGYITDNQIVKSAINELRRCVLDLETLLINKPSKETIQ